jgi:hypothetical protein
MAIDMVTKVATGDPVIRKLIATLQAEDGEKREVSLQ